MGAPAASSLLAPGLRPRKRRRCRSPPSLPTPVRRTRVQVQCLPYGDRRRKERYRSQSPEHGQCGTGSQAGVKHSADSSRAEGKPWTYDNLNAFLTKPKNYAKGTKMTFVGIKKPADRANVILRSLSATPAPLE